MMTEQRILEEVKLGQLHLRNRVAVAPMTRVSTWGDGLSTALMHRYYTRYAQGGFGLVITEGVYTDRLYAQAYPNQPGMTNDEQEKSWVNTVDSVHQAGSKIVLQLMHAGAIITAFVEYTQCFIVATPGLYDEGLQSQAGLFSYAASNELS